MIFGLRVGCKACRIQKADTRLLALERQKDAKRYSLAVRHFAFFLLDSHHLALVSVLVDRDDRGLTVDSGDRGFAAFAPVFDGWDS